MRLVVLEGLRPWVIQRVSAVVIALYLLYVVACLVSGIDADYQVWRSWVFAPYNSLFLGLFILAILFHAWIGLRDVILDYIHNTFIRLILLSAIMLMLTLCGLWALRILLMPLVPQG